VEIALEALRECFRDAAEKVLVFAQTYSGDIGELVVFVDERGV
jgi:hypothetical protein